MKTAKDTQGTQEAQAAKHTPGPWTVKPEESYPPTVTNQEGTDIARCAISVPSCRCQPKMPEAQANARLIAAAPELLEALMNLQDYAERVSADIFYQDTDWFYQFAAASDKARNAIEKATRKATA